MQTSKRILLTEFRPLLTGFTMLSICLFVSIDTWAQDSSEIETLKSYPPQYLTKDGVEMGLEQINWRMKRDRMILGLLERAAMPGSGM